MRDKYITVTALTKYLKRKLEIDPHLQQIFLKGEISNFKHHNRGHMYMTIKDQGAQVKAVMFSSDNERLKFVPENGMNVLIEGNVSVFEAYGQYQLYIRMLEPDGKGALYLAYEQLKKKMAGQGYFETKYKRIIPAFPDNIAVITSPSGAAVRDIISTVKRRYPIAQLTIIPVAVQGETAIPDILDGIATANRLNTFDTIIIGRGGGSIEDLWAFNDERVAKAIFNSNTPVISGIGHETDFTISDFTADLRAPTPTGAAELAVPSLIDLKTRLEQFHTNLFRATKFIILSHKKTLQNLQRASALEKPISLFREKEQYIDKMTDEMRFHLKRIKREHEHAHKQVNMRLAHQNPKQQMRDMNEKIKELKHKLDKSWKDHLQEKNNQLQLNIHQLTLLNPLEIMKRGYAITYADDGAIIASTEKLTVGDDISVRMIDGTAKCKIKEVWKDEKSGGK